MTSPISTSSEKRSGLRRSLRQQKHELSSENTENGSTEVRSDGPDSIGCNNITIQPEHEENDLSPSGMVDTTNETAKSATKSTRKQKRVASRMKGKRYPLRSSLSSGRVLRSMSKEKCKSPPELVGAPVHSVTKERKKRRKVKRASNDEFSVIRKRVRYLLTRMNYEQNFIDAYSGEGWKGQSAEKIRPEKELERAKSEILRCKFKIRELFRHLDSLSSEGRFEESLFDSEGEIDSEDIFCCKCRSKELSADNDIILCDGICDRGFHQKCLDPPLLSEDIPLGDEGWLCPACDCKVDCIELLNEFQGRNISIDDTWEKIFPEAVAIANGNEQDDNLPSDDSEDHDYNPDGPEVDSEVHKDKSDAEESDFSSASEDSDASDSNMPNKNLGFPSDDSEDDDYDPDGLDLKSSPKDGLSSEESDFTSDSDEFCNELSKTSGANEDSASSLQNLMPLAQFGEGTSLGETNNSERLASLETDLNQDNMLVSARRKLERLDYKKLHDEAYGKSSSDSSDDEDWSESADMSTPNRGKYVLRKKADESTPSERNPPSGASAMEHDLPERHHHQQEPDSNGNKSSASAHRRLGEVATQKLYECFQENKYPSREKKGSLAQEIGLTYRQVDKWFINSRHSFRASAKEVPPNGVSSPNKDINAANGKSIICSDEPDGTIVQSSGSSGAKRKQSVAASQPKVGAECGEHEGNITNKVDEDRQKAIARELRKMKQRR